MTITALQDQSIEDLIAILDSASDYSEGNVAAQELYQRSKDHPKLTAEVIVPALIALEKDNFHLVRDTFFNVGHRHWPLIPSFIDHIRDSEWAITLLGHYLSECGALTLENREMMKFVLMKGQPGESAENVAEYLKGIKFLQPFDHSAVSVMTAFREAAVLVNDKMPSVRGHVRYVRINEETIPPTTQERSVTPFVSLSLNGKFKLTHS